MHFITKIKFQQKKRDIKMYIYTLKKGLRFSLNIQCIKNVSNIVELMFLMSSFVENSLNLR